MSRKAGSGTDLNEGPFPEQPWLHEEVVTWLDSIVTAQSRVLEVGAGGSTVWFARRTPYVTSIEHNPQWYEATCNYLNDCGLSASILFRPNYPSEGFEVSEQFDVILIDGEGYTRSKQIACSLPLIVPGGWLILDDAHRGGFREGVQQATAKSKFKIEFEDAKFKEKTIAWRF